MTCPAEEAYGNHGDASDRKPRQSVAELLGAHGPKPREVTPDCWVVSADLHGKRWRVWRRSGTTAIGDADTHRVIEAALSAARATK